MTTPEFAPMTRLPDVRDELIEEALSEIFECRENKVDDEKAIEQILAVKVQADILDELKKSHLVKSSGGRVEMSEKGARIAHEIVRRKRLAERLLKDVLNVKDEFIDPAACQWEHILSKEVTNSICTLLGHPSQSPRNLRIPKGDCCKKASTEIAPVVQSLDKLSGGDKARVAYLLFKENPELNRLLSLGVVPGGLISVIQRFPTFVVQANESQIAFDETIAQSIFVLPL